MSRFLGPAAGHFAVSATGDEEQEDAGAASPGTGTDPVGTLLADLFQ
jgi:hypothetical protein